MEDNATKVDQPETARVLDKAAERRLCFKFDVRLLPVLALMCMYKSCCLAPNVCIMLIDYSRPLQCPRQGQPGQRRDCRAQQR